jgi:CDP-glucose 4,6-dehydratase
VTKEAYGGRRVLVTGASGLVGSWLVRELLARDAYVTALVLDDDPQRDFFRSGDADRVSIVTGDLQDMVALERAVTGHEIDTVFHLGAQALVGPAHRSPHYTFEVNIRGTYNLLEVCRRHRDLVSRIVVASSDKAYGTQTLPYRESSPLLGRHPYEVSKSCADLLAQSYHHTYGTPVTIARCGNIFGGGDLNWSRIVPGTIRDCLHGRRPVIRSDGTFRRDYLYVRDAVEAYLLLGEAVDQPDVAGQAFNFSEETPKTVLEIVDVIQGLMECRDLEPIILAQARGEIPDQWLSAQRARTVLNWQPRHTLRAALSESIDWYRTYFRALPRAAATTA